MLRNTNPQNDGSQPRVASALANTGFGFSSFALVMLAVSLLSGCCQVPGGRCTDWWRNGFKVGPNYCRPPAPVAQEWIDYANPKIKSDENTPCAWWSVFNDPVLNSLIETAYQQNLTLRVA